MSAPSPGSPSRPLVTTFELGTLAGLRRSVAAFARYCGLSTDDVDGFVLAVNEVTANAIAHGGGAGSLRLWKDGNQLRCRISDEGPGLPPDLPADRAGRCQPPLLATGGRGLWIANQICQLEIESTERGTTVNLTSRLPQREYNSPKHLYSSMI